VGFFSPWFLAGIAALGLPLWLHLLRQFKRTPRPFSSLMFFERRIQSSTKHRRLRYIALMIMRMALLALITLAFANPFVNQNSNAAARRSLTIIAVDRSFSMRAGSTRAGDRMAQAKAEAHRAVDSLAGQALAQVAAFDSHLEMLTQAQTDKRAMHAAIDSLEADDDFSSYGELSRSLRVLEQTTGMQLNAQVITDVQRSSMPATFSDLQMGPHVSLTIHKVGRSGAANWAVESVSVPARVYDSANTRLTASIAGWQGNAAQRKVLLEIDGRTLASRDVIVPEGGRVQVEFDGFDVPHGAHRGQIRIEPGDDLPQDDSFAFSIEKSDPRQVLFLYAAGRAGTAFYYKTALEAAKGIGLVVQPFPIERLAEQELSKYAFVVLNDPGALDDKLSEQVKRYVAKGGAALVAVGPSTTREHVVPVAGNTVSAGPGIQGPGHVDEQAPAMAGAGHFENVQFVQAARLIPKQSDRVLAHFADGSPLLIEGCAGEGRLLIFASTLDNLSSDFPVHASFLPFVAQTGAYLSGAQADPSSIVAGTPIALRRTNAQNTAADVIGPDGKHLLDLSTAIRARSYDLTREGFYEVQRASGQRALLAVHADRRESNLTPIDDETLALWRNTGNVAPDAVSRGGQRGESVPFALWRYFLTLALLAAFVESMFGMRYLSDERQTG
jgi:hypothetical protein